MSELGQGAAESVSALTRRLKDTLENSFAAVRVEGEIANFRVYPSGHAYFSIKDEGAVIAAVMFAGRLKACRIAAQLKDGIRVLLAGAITVYPPKGSYQLMVSSLEPLGEGELMLRFLELGRKLKAEGLFERATKVPLPFLPHRIGIVTSEAGAVFHDICRVLSRRLGGPEIRLFPSKVQGVEAPATLLAGLRYFIDNSAWRPEVIIIGRGGGSFEDLFCFNDEQLVRAVASSPVPIVSAVGHETDFTLCDYAASRRAGTPSMAAELVVPVRSELEARIEKAASALIAGLKSRWQWYAQRCDFLSEALDSALWRHERTASERLLALERRLERVGTALLSRVKVYAERLRGLDQSLGLLSPYAVIERGYSLTTTADGEIVRSCTVVAKGDVLRTRLKDGEVISVVREMILESGR